MNEFNAETPSTSFGQTSAYPVPAGSDGGITIRDLLAAMAIQGLTVNGLEVKGDRHMTQQEKDLELANRAYGMADAMIVVRSKEKQPV